MDWESLIIKEVFLGAAFKFGKGTLSIQDFETGDVKFFSKSLMCPTTGIAYEEPEPNFFSFNSPYGACPSCRGLGTVLELTAKKLSLTIHYQ